MLHTHEPPSPLQAVLSGCKQRCPSGQTASRHPKRLMNTAEGQPRLTRRVCSNCAERCPSAVTEVQLSGQVLSCSRHEVNACTRRARGGGWGEAWQARVIVDKATQPARFQGQAESGRGDLHPRGTRSRGRNPHPASRATWHADALKRLSANQVAMACCT